MALMNPLRSHVDNHFDALRSPFPFPERLTHGTNAASTDSDFSADSDPSAAKPAKRRRRYWYPQRDSLARRNLLQIGKEGSRRRQRWDNNHFCDHPLAKLVVPDDEDQLFMGTAPPFRWVSSDQQVMSILLDDDMDSVLYRYEACVAVPRQPAPLTRNMRRDLKKTNIPERLVYYYENQIIAYLTEQDLDLVMVLDIDDAFARWVVHTMCSYYNLVSFTDSDRDQQRCLLYIQHTSSTSTSTLEEPACLFSEFLFSR